LTVRIFCENFGGIGLAGAKCVRLLWRRRRSLVEQSLVLVLELVVLQLELVVLQLEQLDVVQRCALRGVDVREQLS
jgi:hypothetical protein